MVMPVDISNWRVARRAINGLPEVPPTLPAKAKDPVRDYVPGKNGKSQSLQGYTIPKVAALRVQTDRPGVVGAPEIPKARIPVQLEGNGGGMTEEQRQPDGPSAHPKEDQDRNRRR